MQARGPLMIEHRLIERMVALMVRAMEGIEATGTLDPDFIDTAVDFMRVYTDRTHHGKEEDIFFRDLDRKDLSDEDRRLMNELIEEHVFGRKVLGELVEAAARYRAGDTAAAKDAAAALRTLTDFYPKHIEKEDKVFFPASRAYLSDEEEQAMLAEYDEYDRRMIHEKYQAVVTALEGQ